MARKVRNRSLENRTSRARLRPRGKPYYCGLQGGLHLGYRRLKTLDGTERDGTWVVRRYIGKGKYKVEAIGAADDKSDADGNEILTFDQAQDAARRLARKPTGDAERGGPFTVADALRDYFAKQRDEGAKGVDDDEGRANAHIVPALGAIEVSKLTTKQLRRWLGVLSKSKPRVRSKKGKEQKLRDVDMTDDEVIRKRRASANRTWTILRAALNHAFEEDEEKERVPSNRAWARVKPFSETDAARLRFPTSDECLRLINASAVDFRLMVEGGLHTGARYAELGRLRVHDFNPAAKNVFVAKSKAGRARHVPLTDEGVRFFSRVIVGKPRNALVFTKADGSAWKKSEQDRPIRSASAAAKIEPHMNFHSFRHYYASQSIMAGAPLQVVAKALGHRDTRMVEKFYGHLAPDWVANAIRQAAPTFGLEPETNVVPLAEARA